MVKSCTADTVGVEVGDEEAPPGDATAGEEEQQQQQELPELTERSVLYAYLLQARHCAFGTVETVGDEVDFGPFARSLPDNFSTPFSWREELGLLPGAPLAPRSVEWWRSAVRCHVRCSADGGWV